MLDEKDLQAIRGIVADSEGRTKSYIDSSVAAAENRWMAFYEASISPKFDILVEGHQTLLETLAPKSRVDNLEEDVVFLKSIVKSLMQEVTELKKAQ